MQSTSARANRSTTSSCSPSYDFEPPWDTCLGSWLIVADAYLVAIGEFERVKPIRVNCNQGQISLGVATDHLGGGAASVSQEDLNGVGAANHMMIGEDVALIAEDHAATETAFDVFAR